MSEENEDKKEKEYKKDPWQHRHIYLPEVEFGIMPDFPKGSGCPADFLPIYEDDE